MRVHLRSHFNPGAARRPLMARAMTGRRPEAGSSQAAGHLDGSFGARFIVCVAVELILAALGAGFVPRPARSVNKAADVNQKRIAGQSRAPFRGQRRAFLSYPWTKCPIAVRLLRPEKARGTGRRTAKRVNPPANVAQFDKSSPAGRKGNRPCYRSEENDWFSGLSLRGEQYNSEHR